MALAKSMRDKYHREISTQADNHFDMLRLIFAFMVVLAHYKVLTGTAILDSVPMLRNSDFAIKGFFTISGFLVTLSYYNSTNLAEYAKKRLRRIVPAYIVVICFCLFLGLVFTSASRWSFLADAQTYGYLLSILSFLNFLEPALPGVFEGHNYPVMNGALWTIKVELMLYACVPVLVLMYKYVGVRTTLALVFFASVAYTIFFEIYVTHPLGDRVARQFPGQLAYFVIGSVLAIRPFEKLYFLVIASGLLFILWENEIVRSFSEPIFYASLVVYAAKFGVEKCSARLSSDYSYGVYLFHFPITQGLVQSGFVEKNEWFGLIACLILTLFAAMLSWHLVEKKFLIKS